MWWQRTVFGEGSCLHYYVNLQLLKCMVFVKFRGQRGWGKAQIWGRSCLPTHAAMCLPDSALFGKGQNPLHQFPRIANAYKSVTSWREQKSVVCCVVSFPEYHYNDLLPTCYGLVSRVANKSATSWKLSRLRGNYGETCLMDFGHKQARIYYGSVIGGYCCICAGQTLRVHSADGSTFLSEMRSWPPS